MNAPVLIDLETRSACDLKEEGGHNYATHPSTRLLCVGWTADLGETYHVWVPGHAGVPLPDADIVWHFGPECPLASLTDRVWIAHNAWLFDRLVWDALGLPAPRKWWDSYCLALASGLPGGLDQIGTRLWGEGKHQEGRSALKKYSRADSVEDADPRNVPPGITRLIAAYCVQDVRLLNSLWGELNATATPSAVETRVQSTHDRINERGIRLDVPFVLALRELCDAAVDDAVREIATLTGGELPDVGTLRKRNAVISWLETRGLSITTVDNGKVKKTLRREIVEQWLVQHTDPEEEEGDDAPETDPDAGGVQITPASLRLCARVLTLRNAVLRITGKKLTRALSSVQADGIVRGLFGYHSAHTGRWGGRRIQVQNLTRPAETVDVWGSTNVVRWMCRKPRALPEVKKRFAPVIERHLAKLRAKAKLGAIYNPPTLDDIASSLLRGMFVPNAGHECLMAADYSSIEARALAWLAGETTLLQTFHDRGCPYSLMAEKLYGRKPKDKKDPIRQVGKVIVLGCLRRGTPVLTDRGWVAIEAVRLTDRVWDGEHWVRHGGVVSKGVKEVYQCAGVWMTADHEVLTENGRLPSGTYSTSGRFSLSPLARAGTSWLPCAAVRADTSGLCSPVTCVTDGPSGAVNVPTGASTHRLARSEESYATPSCAAVCYPGSLGLSRDVATPHTPDTTNTADAAFECAPSGLRIGACGCGICSPYRATTTRSYNWTERTTSEGTNRGTFGSSLPRSIRETPAALTGYLTQEELTAPRTSGAPSFLSTEAPDPCTVTLTPGETPLTSSVESTHDETFDIVNAGPNHRFQAGPLLVHNCGYGLGEVRFALYGASAGIDFDEMGVSAAQCVDAFRTAFPHIAGHVQGEYEGRKWRRGGFWNDLNDAALTACDRPGEVAVGRLVFEKRLGHLYLTLPSGRTLCYRQVRVVPSTTWWGKTVHVVEYQSPRFKATRMYGGKWAENVVQATCRDPLAEALVRLEAEGLGANLHVHDEAVRSGYYEEFPRFMKAFTTCPAWASGLPLDAEGGIMPRYAKAPPPHWPAEQLWRNGEKL